MSQITFQDDTNEFGPPPTTDTSGDFSDKLIKWGLASNREQAEYILIGIAVVALIAAFFVYRMA